MKVRQISLSLSLVIWALAGGAPAARAAGPEDSIVKVTSVLRLPNPVRPWTKLNPREAGGTTLSTTSGIVSRIEFVDYEAGTMGLRLQVDAAINPGNSGGPALVDGKMVGLVWGQAGAENVGYLIPNEEISPVMREAVSFYLRANPEIIGRNSPMLTRGADRVRFPGEELVAVTSPMLPHRMTKGYGEPLGQVVESVNGTRINNLCHLVERIQDGTDEFLTIRFAEDGAETMVFRRRAMLDETESLMSQNGIPRRGSDDVLTSGIVKRVLDRVPSR
jgi:hypothetical protein